MKIRLCYALVVFLFSGICLAQVPTRPIGSLPGSNEISVDFLLPVKSPHGLTSLAYGGGLAGIHFFNEHFGIKLQCDYERSDYVNYSDAACRSGALMHFSSTHKLHPYVEALVGYSHFHDSKIHTSYYYSSPSLLAGGGFEFPLARAWNGRVGADLQDDWSKHTKVGTASLGISYRLGVK